MGKPVDRKSPEADKARAQNEPLYTAIGEAITHWSDLEGRLVRIAAELLRGAPIERVGLVLYSVANFHTWIAVIDDLLALDGTYPNSAARWHKLTKRLKAENDIRVRLAHQGIPLDAPGQLRRHKFDVRSKSVAGRPLTIEEIKAFIERVDTLYADLIDLLILMRQPQSSR